VTGTSQGSAAAYRRDEGVDMKRGLGVVAVEGFESALPGEVIGYWKGGRPIFLAGGAAPDGDDDDDGDLFDDDNDSDGSDDGDGDDESTDGDDDAGDGDDKPLTRAQISKMVAKEANRIADRRINQALRKQWGRRGNQGRSTDDRGDSDKDTSGGRVASTDVREARAVYRDEVRDVIRFVSDDERALAGDIASGLLRERLREGDEPDEAGEAVAREVADRVKGLRRTYQSATIRRLQSLGHLPKDFDVRKQPARGQSGGSASATSSWAKGEARAKEMFGDRLPQSEAAGSR
jgi:hypothetical protein